MDFLNKKQELKMQREQSHKRRMNDQKRVTRGELNIILAATARDIEGLQRLATGLNVGFMVLQDVLAEKRVVTEEEYKIKVAQKDTEIKKIRVIMQEKLTDTEKYLKIKDIVSEPAKYGINDPALQKGCD